MEVTPASVLGMWAGGIAGSVAFVARSRIVGPGFVRLGGAVAGLVGIGAAFGTVGGAFGCLLAGAMAVLAPRPGAAAAAGALGALGFLVGAAGDGTIVATVSGAVFLGAVTGEMILGHWYLVDPRLPRPALRRLAGAALVGVVADTVVVTLSGVMPVTTGDGGVALGFAALAAITALLLAGVLGALRESGYAGVMAATGLSYLALLTALGAAVVGRMLASGPVVA